ncbi:hypothetical protein EKN09_26115, partial [Vibrio penaeicida]
MKKILLIALSVGLIACGGGESTQAEKQKETTITKTHSGCKIEEKKAICDSDVKSFDWLSSNRDINYLKLSNVTLTTELINSIPDSNDNILGL